MAYVDEQTQRINDLYANLKKQQTDQAAAQNNQAIEALRKQLAEQLPQYQTARAQADVGQVQNMNKLKEYMANSGAFNSGDNLSRASNILTQRANTVNQINGNENQFTTGINTKIADSNNQYNNTVSSINSSLDAQRAKDIASLMEQIRQQDLAAQEAEKQRQFQAQQALEAYQRQQEQIKQQQAYEATQAEKAYQRQVALQQQQAAAAAKASASRASSSSSRSKAPSKTDLQNQYYAKFKQAINDRDYELAKSLVYDDQNGIIQDLGGSFWNKLEKEFWKWQAG